MKKLLGILVLGLFLITPSQADDIRESEIEGMSIGDSALDYFSENELIQNKEYYKNSKSKTFFLTNVYSSSFEIYDNLMFHFKDNDPKYIIHSIAGALFFSDDGIRNTEECMIERKKVDKELTEIFYNSKRVVGDDRPHEGDITGQSFEHGIYYWLKEGSLASVSCNEYSKAFGGNNHLKVIVYSKAFAHWITNVAYE